MTEEFIQELEKISSEDLEKILIEKKKKEGKRYITLKENDTMKLEIKDANGNPTGEYLEFDLEDLSLPLKYQEMYDKVKRHKQDFKNKINIIKKKQDVKKGLLSKNQISIIEVTNEFFKNIAEDYNMFLGDNGYQKILNGRKLGWTTIEEIEEIVEEQITPYLDFSMEHVENKIKEKYSKFAERNKVLKNE